MAIWYTDGSQNQVSRGIKEMVEIIKSTLSIPVQHFLKTSPRENNFTHLYSKKEIQNWPTLKSSGEKVILKKTQNNTQKQNKQTLPPPPHRYN